MNVASISYEIVYETTTTTATTANPPAIAKLDETRREMFVSVFVSVRDVNE
jgi:hypothetical protein